MAIDTFASIIREHAAARPAAPALTFDGRTQSFAALHAASSRLGQVPATQGVGPYDRVTVLSRKRPEFFAAIIAASKLGVILVGLYWRLSPREMGAIVADAQTAIILVDEPSRRTNRGWRFLPDPRSAARSSPSGRRSRPNGPAAPRSIRGITTRRTRQC